MIADWTVLDQSFFLCKQNFPKLVVCAGKVQNADVLIHQKILAGMCVFLHLVDDFFEFAFVFTQWKGFKTDSRDAGGQYVGCFLSFLFTLMEMSAAG